MSKRLDRAYCSGRSRDWPKPKCVLTDAFVIIGFQPGSGAVRTPLTNIVSPASTGVDCATLAPSARARRARRCSASDAPGLYKDQALPDCRAEGRGRRVRVAGPYCVGHLQ